MNLDRLQRFKGNLYVCGFMASGKSTIGRAVAKSLGWEFKDLDAEIESRYKKKIRDIFKEEGEDSFRKKEWECLLDLSHNFKGVVALGGGALQNQSIVDHLKISGLLIFIDTPMDEIVERVYRKNHRPILFDEEGKIKSKETLFTELKALYLSRIDLYNQAQIHINTSTISSVEAITEVAIDKITRHV